MKFSDHFTLLSALEIMTPMEIVINYDINDLIKQLDRYSKEVDLNKFIADVIEEAEETEKIVEVFITMSSKLKC